MSRARLLVGGLAALTAISLFMPRGDPEVTRSSFGTTPTGHKALFELLAALGVSGGRSLESPLRLAPEGTLWFVEPRGVCRAPDSDAPEWNAVPWIEAGGTAVVWLAPPHREDAADETDSGEEIGLGGGSGRSDRFEENDGWEMDDCEELGGLGLPVRRRIGAGMSIATVSGPLTPEPRELALPQAVAVFAATAEWSLRASLAADSEQGAFVLERALGRGRIAVVADAGFVRNQNLDAADSGLLAVDLVRAFGVPRFDERVHGFVPEANPVQYLARSEALSVFVGLLLLGLAFAWRGAALPPRELADLDPNAPTLESFVESLAALYAGTRDHARVFERYRELSLDRLRRHFGLAPDVPARVLLERLERTRSVVAERDALAALVGRGPIPQTEEDLSRATRALDELVQEVAS